MSFFIEKKPGDVPTGIGIAAFLFLLLPSCRTIEETAEDAGGIDQPTFVVADADEDGKLSQQELAEHKHREALAEFDLNNDSLISAAEWAAAKPSAGENDEHFNRLDKNGNGKVSRDEAVLYITEHVSFGDAFKKLDSNGDFHLHWEEIDAGAPGDLNITLFSVRPGAVQSGSDSSP